MANCLSFDFFYWVLRNNGPKSSKRYQYSEQALKRNILTEALVA